MSHPEDHDDDDPIIVKPSLKSIIIVVLAIVVSAIAGGVAGYLIGQSSQSRNIEDLECPPSVAAVHDGAQQARIVDAI